MHQAPGRAALRHRPAAFLAPLQREAPPPPEVTIPTAPASGIVVHRVRSLNPRDVVEVAGIRVTSVSRTLLDLAPVIDPETLTRLCHEAWVHHRTTPAHVDACIARNHGKKGAAKLRAAVSLSDRV